MNSEFAAYVRRRWWFVGAQALVALIAVTAVLAARNETSYAHTSHFVLHPDPRSSVNDANNSVGVSRQDGPLVQTVLSVLNSDEMLRRAALDAGIRDTSALGISATVAPGTTYFDAVVTGPSAEAVAKVGRAFEAVVPRYVVTSYHGFAFDVLGSDESTHTTFPPHADVVVLALVLGAAAALAELFVVFALTRRRTTEGADAVVPPGADGRGRGVPVGASGNGNRGTGGNGDGDGEGEDDGPRRRVPAKGRRGRARSRSREAGWQAPAAS
jgi:hypothetical protein